MYIFYILEYLLPWKITAERDAEVYLHRFPPKDLEGSRTGNHNGDENCGKSYDLETNNSIKTVSYTHLTLPTKRIV